MAAHLDNRDAWSGYASAEPQLEQNSLACVGAGEQFGLVAAFSDRALATHGLVLVSQGSGSFASEGVTTRVHSPAALWLYPGVAHSYGPDGNGWAEHWILFTGTSARVYEGLRLVERSRPAVHLEYTPVGLPHLFGILRGQLGVSGPRSALRSSGAVQNIIESTISASAGHGTNRQGSSIVQTLEATAFESGSVGQRARALRVSTRVLRTAVHEETGLTPIDYVVTLRIVRARELLASTTLSIGEIARAVGYDDPAYFSRLFARRVGESPSRFRHQHYRAPKTLN
jgi:AraC-like DNA-binding protein